MNIYERAGSLRLRLETSLREDRHQELQQQATRLLSELCDCTAFLRRVIVLQDALALEERPRLDEARLRKAVGGLRSALTQHDAAAVQQQASVTLSDALRRIEDGLAKWALSAWQAKFEDLRLIADHDDLRSIIGSDSKAIRTKRIASQLSSALGRNPIRDPEGIQRVLETEDLDACVAKVRELGAELRMLLDELHRTRVSLPVEVQKTLDDAASDDGIPLEDMTEDLLKALQEAGVLGEFVVRRY